MATEKEKMLRGDLYNANDPELIQGRRNARVLIKQFNETPRNTPEATAIMQQLFGSLGKGVIIEPLLRCDYGYNIHLGDDVYMNFNCVLLDVCEIRIGRKTLLAPGVQIYTASHPLDPAVRASGLEDGKPVTIEDGVWIGGGAIILPGVTIGQNSVIGAGSVVTKDVPPNTVYAGNPAKFIKNLDGTK